MDLADQDLQAFQRAEQAKGDAIHWLAGFETALDSRDVGRIADLFHEAEDLMADAGIEAYEISNFARAGFGSRHNLKYWDDGPFHAFGMSAHGFDGGVRYWNEPTFGAYCTAMETRGIARAGERTLSRRERLEEAVMTGLRVRQGINREAFRVRHGVDVLDQFGESLRPSVTAGLLEVDETTVRLTRRGVLMSSEVLVAVV